MLDDPFPNLKGQVQSAKGRVADLEILHDAQRVQVVIEEEPVLAHEGVERLFPSVPKGWMPEIVHQGQRLHQVDVHMQGRGQRARNLRNLKGVCQAVAEMIGEAPREDLRLCFQPPECSGVDDAVAIALKVVAVGMLELRIAPTARLFNTNRVISEHVRSLVSKFQGFKVSKTRAFESLKPRYF